MIVDQIQPAHNIEYEIRFRLTVSAWGFPWALQRSKPLVWAQRRQETPLACCLHCHSCSFCLWTHLPLRSDSSSPCCMEFSRHRTPCSFSDACHDTIDQSLSSPQTRYPLNAHPPLKKDRLVMNIDGSCRVDAVVIISHVLTVREWSMHSRLAVFLGTCLLLVRECYLG